MSRTLPAADVTRLRKKRVLFVYPVHFSTFIERDWKIISGAFPESELFCLAGFKSMWRLRAAVRRADLIFCWFGGRNALAAAFWNRRRKPLVIVAGGYDVASVPELGYGTFASRSQARFGRWIFVRTDLVLAVSDFTAQCARYIAGIPAERIKTIYHGFDSSEWTPVDMPRRIDVMTISNEDLRRKGLDLILGSAQALPQLRFSVVGRISPADCRQFAPRIPANVEFLGPRYGNDLKKLFSQTKVYLQPSRHESFGCAVAEAMLMGCIPVVARATAQPEVVGDAGFYAEPLTVEGVVEAVNKALAAPETMRGEARERIARKFALKDYAHNLISHIDEVLVEREKSRAVA
jgi:glycosyltransferase involved in cell wall biosynthesis